MPCVRDVGLWGDRVRSAYEKMGVLDNAKADLEALMKQDEEIAEKVDEERYAAELAERKKEVDEAIALGGAAE